MTNGEGDHRETFSSRKRDGTGEPLSRATEQGYGTPGYVSGETLRSLDDPSLWVVLSTWLDADLWKAWEASPERKEIEDSIGRITSAPAKVSAFSFMWKACWSENEAERWRNISSVATKHPS